ncbi:hypothetical protein Droror1_Dr00014836 [Drosera rotundifolia]
MKGSTCLRPFQHMMASCQFWLEIAWGGCDGSESVDFCDGKKVLASEKALLLIRLDLMYLRRDLTNQPRETEVRFVCSEPKVVVVSNFDTRLRPLLRALDCEH